MNHDEAHIWTDAKIAEMEAALRNHYIEATAEMLEKQGQFMKAYESEKAKWDDKLRTMKITPAEHRRQMAEYEMKREWFNEMVDSLAEGALNADKKAADIVNDSIPEIYRENYNFAGYQVESGLNINTNFSLMDEDTLRRLIRDDPDLVPKWKVNEPKDYRWNKQKFNSAMTQGLLQGESLDAMAARIESVVGMNFNSARTNARTAATAAQNAGRLQSLLRMKANGIDVKKQWLATLDHRTRDSHRREDYSVQELEERFQNTGLMYPGDMSTNDPGEVYNCRCTLAASFDAVTRSSSARFSRLGNQSYKSWKAGRSRK